MMLGMVDGRVVNPEGLEVNATFQCNMRCRSCSHFAPLYRTHNVDAEALHGTLSTLAESYHAAYVKILGGEPLMHPDLLAVIGAVRASKVSDTVLVCTNGTLLARARPEFWAAVDTVEVSVYPSRPLRHDEIRGFHAVARKHGVELVVNYYGHFRNAYAEEGTGSAELVRDIFDTCKVAHLWLAHTVQDGWLYRCPQSMVLPEQLKSASWDRHVDGIEIEDDPGFADRLLAFLNRTTPLRACRYCLGSVGTLHPHVEVPRQQWRTAGPTEDNLDREYLTLVKRDITIDDGCEEPACPVLDETASPPSR